MIKGKVGMMVNPSINTVYTAIFFSPVIFFWKDYYTTVCFKIALGIAICSFFLPNRFYTFLQLSDSKSFYKKIGIPIFQQITQQGKFANRMITYFGGNVLLLPKEKRFKQLKG
ncbi:MAG: hypothetical protein IPM26_01105 [Saprospiraceae bacterium]|nr:hypothetical protein [Saprospiraceae bacterium]